LLIPLVRRAEPLFIAILLLLPIYHYLPIQHHYPLMTTGIVHFMLGIMLARYRQRLANLALLRSAWSRALFLVFGVTCMSVRHVFNVPLQLYHPYSMTLWDISAFGSFIVIWAGLVSVPFQRLLCLSWIQWLGRVSYSLYLWHMTVLYLLVPRILQMGNAAGVVGWTAWLFGLAGAVLLSLVVAQCFYWAIERPCTRLARRVAGSRAKTLSASMRFA
jgi:peptidoglycan/LPS O-acetylase OafA/YrhL